MWTLTLLAIITYVAGTFLVQAVHNYRITLSEDERELEVAKSLAFYYGSLPRAALSLFQGLTGGFDWNDLMSPLLDTGIAPGHGIMVIVYLSFGLIVLMNIVTGTLVQSVSERQVQLSERRKIIQARTLFKELDADGSGTISANEITDHADIDAVQEFLWSADVDIHEAQCLIEVIDLDGSGQIDIDEFLHGSLRLQGPAMSRDLMLLARECRQFFEFLSVSATNLEQDVQLMRRKLSI